MTSQRGRPGFVLPLSWKFSQIFEPEMAKEKCMDDPQATVCDSEISKDVQAGTKLHSDVISAVQFDKTGGLIATGDNGGHIVLYEQCDVKNCCKPRNTMERMDRACTTLVKYHFKTEFLSHETKVDSYSNKLIENKINKITWCPAPNAANLLLSTSDTTIKLWKVQDKKVKKISTLSVEIPKGLGYSTTTSASASTTVSSRPKIAYAWHYGRSGSSLAREGSRACKDSLSFSPRLPKLESSTVAACRRTYDKRHDSKINSISINSDYETFISADDFNINLWNLEISGQTFNIVNLKSVNQDHVSEMIRAAEFHPGHCNILAYGTSKGFIRLLDLRQSAICDRTGKLFATRDHMSSRTAAMEAASSVADIKFKNDGRHMISRDFMTLKLWDINMNSGPVATFNVLENTRSQIKELYDRQLLFDKFDCSLSGDGRCAATGSYSYQFKLFDLSPGSTDTRTLQTGWLPQRMNVQSGTPWKLRSLERCGLKVTHGVDDNGCQYFDTMKLLNLAWHPSRNVIACAVADSLFLYCES